MIKLKRLKIDKYRRVAPGTELVFDEGMNVLLGRNGSGKTTLLNLISMCLRSDFSALEKEEFAIEYEMLLAGASQFVRIKNVREEARVIPELPGDEWRPGAFSKGESFAYEVEIAFCHELPTRTFRFWSNAAKGLFEEIQHGSISISEEIPPFSPFKPGTMTGAYFKGSGISGGVSDLVTWVRSYRPAYRFDESLQMFEAMFGVSALTDTLGMPSIRVEIVMQLDGIPKYFRSEFISNEAIGTIFSSRLEPSEFTEVSVAHTKLSFLERYVRETGFLSAELKLPVLEKTRDADTLKIRLGELTFFFTYKDGSGIHHDLLSYGQKRLLAFLYYLDCNKDIVIADELVNGLHHEWIDACIDAIGQRQAFLTSQNPLLLDYLSFESAEQAQRAFIRCHTEELQSGRSQMHWANMAKDDAERFHRGYLAGIQHVSEILRTEGLW